MNKTFHIILFRVDYFYSRNRNPTHLERCFPAHETRGSVQSLHTAHQWPGGHLRGVQCYIGHDEGVTSWLDGVAHLLKVISRSMSKVKGHESHDKKPNLPFPIVPL